jgi:hypothetical protein
MAQLWYLGKSDYSVNSRAEQTLAMITSHANFGHCYASCCCSRDKGVLPCKMRSTMLPKSKLVQELRSVRCQTLTGIYDKINELKLDGGYLNLEDDYKVEYLLMSLDDSEQHPPHSEKPDREKYPWGVSYAEYVSHVPPFMFSHVTHEMFFHSFGNLGFGNLMDIAREPHWQVQAAWDTPRKSLPHIKCMLLTTMAIDGSGRLLRSEVLTILRIMIARLQTPSTRAHIDAPVGTPLHARKLRHARLY